MLSSYYAPKTCFCSLKLQENKVSLLYSLMMIILDCLHYWNLCCVKTTGLTLLYFIPPEKEVSLLASKISFVYMKSMLEN